MENNKKIFCVITVARQIEGEFIFIRTEKGFNSAAKADKLLQHLKADYQNHDGTVKPVRLSTPNGDADCICSVGAFEIELED